MKATDHLNLFISNLDGFAWKESDAPGKFTLCSGNWKGGLWQHEVVVVNPDQMQPGTALLYITGGAVNELDLVEAKCIADRSGLAVAMLFDIPNQPLFEMREDDLIAHTFERYIETGDPTWPLLFPMVRAAIRAIDLLQVLGFERVVVTGASKRGWTTWLAGATGDSRIIGIAPMVIDNLDFHAQMAHQVETWGGYSEQIEDYTSRDLQDSMDSERGKDLTTMMDPISYIDRVRCPILIINGSNDPYWTVDSLSLYWDRLPLSTRCLIVPNAGHLLGDKRMMMATLSAFAGTCSVGELLPSTAAELVCTDRLVGAKIDSSQQEEESHLWVAVSPTLDFRDSEWSRDPGLMRASESEWDLVTSGQSGQKGIVVEADARSSQTLLVAMRPRALSGSVRINVALMTESVFTGPTGRFSLSTPVKVFPA